MKIFNVTGMTCAACSARVEKAVKSLNGVTECSVNLLTNSVSVDGQVSDTEIIKAVTDAGYGIMPQNSSKDKNNKRDVLTDTETPIMKKRLLSSVISLIILMYFSMGHMIHLPLPHFLAHNHMANGMIQLILSAAVMIINQKFFINGFKGMVNKSPNMDTLVALGSGAAFGYSTYILFIMSDAYANSKLDVAQSLIHEFYFESAAMILTLITVGKMLEARAKGKTTDALKSLMKLVPKTACIIVDGTEKTVDISDVKKGDILAVRPGESIPVDAVVVSGLSAVNESALTGESIPADKKAGDKVSASTVNMSGYLECEAVRVGEDTTISQIIKMVSDAAATKAPIAKIADKVSGVFVPVVITIAIITTAVWLILGESAGFALARGISVLVISCPCALGLATPVAIMVGNGVGAKKGILFKTASALETAGKIKTVVLDKTGTITKGEPVVTDIVPQDGMEEEYLVQLAYSAEKLSEHPLAKAIVKYAENKGISSLDTDDFKVFPGNGLEAVIEKKTLLGGNMDFVSSHSNVPDKFRDVAINLSETGKTPLFFSYDNQFAGIIAVADIIKGDSPKAINELKNMGINVVMLTGDNEKTAMSIGKSAGVDRVIAGVLPDGKEKTIRTLCENGKTAMVGDGINDAPALTRADVGIAIGAGTDVAIDAADVVLVNSTLSDVPALIRLSRATLKNIKENLFWAFIYNIIGIPLAAGVYINILGWELNPMFGAAAMSLSSFCVVTNALRLNFINIYSSKNDKTNKNNNIKEKKTMEKLLKIEGMMCPHCEARVKKVLSELDGVTEVIPSHKDGTALVKMSENVSDELLKKTVEDQGYKVL